MKTTKIINRTEICKKIKIWSKLNLLFFFCRLSLVSIMLTILASAYTPFQLSATPHVEAALVSEVESIQPGKPFALALRLKMEEQWHTYWRNPGDAGLATSVKWQLPEGFQASPIQWPYPHKFGEVPVISFGYDKEVLLISELQPPPSLKPGTSISLAISANWLVCKEECLPGRGEWKLTLLVKEETPKLNANWADRFAAMRAKLPISSSEWKISTKLASESVVIGISPPSSFPGTLNEVLFFPYEAGIVDYSCEQKLSKEGSQYILEMKKSPFFNKPPARLRGILYLPQGWRGNGSARALEVDVPFSN
ncbi:MAG: protein-disulfide reductase DsbD domain-containing protein [Acidobacteriota bacterium]